MYTWTTSNQWNLDLLH